MGSGGEQELEELVTSREEVAIICKLRGPNQQNEVITCGKKMPPDQLKHHEPVCLYRQFECKFCKMESTYIAITGQTQTVMKEAKTPEEKGHYAQCPDYPLSCKNRCSSKVIRRGDMEQHLQECPLELIRCERWEEGCKEMVLRKDLKKHMKKYETQHNNYTHSAYQRLKDELKKAKAETHEAQQTAAEKSKLAIIRETELATVKTQLESVTQDYKKMMQATLKIAGASYTSSKSNGFSHMNGLEKEEETTYRLEPDGTLSTASDSCSTEHIFPLSTEHLFPIEEEEAEVREEAEVKEEEEVEERERRWARNQPEMHSLPPQELNIHRIALQLAAQRKFEPATAPK